MEFDAKDGALSTILALVAVCIIGLFANGCASLKYGTDVDYVRSLRNPVYVGTQINGNKLMSDSGVIFAGIDLIPSGLADTGMLPWYLGLYWWNDDTVLPYKIPANGRND